jgi:hypothetical protein
MLRVVLWVLWLLGVRAQQPSPPVAEVVDDDRLEWLDDPDEITNARWYAQHCYDLPAAKR